MAASHARPQRPPHARLVLAVTGLLLAVMAAPASGHASGELPHARLSADGHEVVVVWTAAEDDAADVVVAAGLWPDEVFLAYLDVAFGGPTELLPGPAEVAAVSRAPALRDYLEDRIRIIQDGARCPGTAEPAADFIADGATVRFDCPEPVTRAVVDIRVLHDRDPSYRTFSVDGTVQYAVHTATRPAHDWDFTAAPGPVGTGSSNLLPLAGGAAGVTVVAAVLLLWLWRPARRPRRQGRR